MSFQRAGIHFGGTRDAFLGLWMDLGRTRLDLGGALLGFRGFLHTGCFCCDIMCCHGDVGTHSVVRLGWDSWVPPVPTGC